MELNNLITNIILGVTALLISSITAYFTKQKTKHNNLSQYIEILERLTVASVQSVNGELVDTLKMGKAFTRERQAEAFNKALVNVKSQLTLEARNALKVAYGDLDKYIETLIIAKVEDVKLEKRVADKPAVAVEVKTSEVDKGDK